MRRHKVFVIKRYMTNDTQSVGDNAKLEDITKMPVDIKLFDLRISRSMGRHGAIGSFVGIKRFIKSLSFRIGMDHRSRERPGKVPEMGGGPGAGGGQPAVSLEPSGA